MTTWDQFRPVLQRLVAERPDALAQWPDPSNPYRPGPPFEIGLQAFAVDIADELHKRYGTDVTLQVGVMSFPDKQLENPRMAESVPDLPLAEQAGLDVQLATPLTVRSGRTIEHAVLVANRSDADVVIATAGGHLQSDVLDPRTGQRVGGYFGGVRLSLVTFQVARSGQRRIPVTVGTTSIVPELGYAVPAGAWHLQVTLNVGHDDQTRPLRSAPLPMTITA